MQVPLSILIYHRISAEPDPLFPEEVDARRFAQQIRLLSRWFHLMPLIDAVRALQSRSLPNRTACITFDDGYADSAEVALPILQRYRAPATFFVPSGFLDGGCLWNDAIIELVRNAPGPRLDLTRSGFGVYDIACNGRRRAVIDTLLAALKYLPSEERIERVKLMARRFSPTMLSSDQVLALHRAGMDIGAHTVSHAILSAVSNADARAEIANGRAHLQEIIQAPVRLFAYPNGKPGRDFEQRHVQMLRSQGFEGAVTTAWGAARSDTDPFMLPRFTPWDRGSSRFLLRLGSNLFMPPA
jgi:peptidoglycan/xylan/chitin deacetylase (PgdA/CDA1 family)